jgi:hypothetical protein
MTPLPTSLTLLNTLPDQETIRTRLAEIAREQRTLRSLLRVTIKRDQCRSGESSKQGAPMPGVSLRICHGDQDCAAPAQCTGDNGGVG